MQKGLDLLRSGPSALSMKHYLNRREDPLDELVDAIHNLTFVLATRGREQVTKQDLDNLEQNISMKLSKLTAELKAVNDKLTEGLQEINDHIAKIVADNADPEVTDQAFTAELAALQEKADKFANLANPEGQNSETPTPPVEDPNGEPVTEPTPAPNA